MFEYEVNLVNSQIDAVRKEFALRDIDIIYLVACGGSLATLYPIKYVMERETDKIFIASHSANEFFYDPPKHLINSLVILNSQSGNTSETVNAAKLAHEQGALCVAFTTKPESNLEKNVDKTIYYYDNPANPYPLLLSIFPEVYQLTFALLDEIEKTNRLPDMRTAMENLEAVCQDSVAKFKPQALSFAEKHLTEPLIYTVSAGLDSCVAYILTNCSFMESIWRDSSPIHAGELLHGACEAIDEDTPVFAFLGLGKYRPVEERAVKFLQRITKKLTVLDASALNLSPLPEWTREYVAPLVLHSIASDYCLQLSNLMGHPMSSRRYMGIMNY